LEVVVPENAPIEVPNKSLSAVDMRTPNVARIYDYILGGKDNFAIDREAAKQVIAAFPEARDLALVARAFQRRAVEFLAREAGIRQFLDIGSGLPTQQHVHDIALAVAPDAHVVYVDHDPVVCTHGRALLEDGDRVAVVEADLRRPAEILGHPTTRRFIDFTQPVAILLLAVVHLISDDEDPFSIVAQLRDSMAPGSYLIVSHILETESRKSDTDQLKEVYSRADSGVFPRTLDQVVQLVDGLELLDVNQFVTPDVLERFADFDFGWIAIGRKP
jgi:hypothetical protein